MQDTKQLHLGKLEDQVKVEINEDPILHRITTKGDFVHFDERKNNFRGEESEEGIYEDFSVPDSVKHRGYVGMVLPGGFDELQ
ncbi:hypothetical protein D3C81_1469740 [compost metagenome]